MISPGDDYSFYEPLEQREDEIGSHQANFRALNVFNPQPGWRYYWAHYSKRDNFSELTRFIDHEGWQPVLEGEPEYGTSRTHSFLTSQPNADRLKLFGDVCLIKIQEERYRELQAEQNTAATRQLYGLKAAHEARGEDMARQFRHGLGYKGRPVYYARDDHQLDIEEFDPSKMGNTRE